jgi:hypothetical protein
MILTAENQRTRRKSSATLSNTNPTRTDLDANCGLRNETVPTNPLTDGTAQLCTLIKQIIKIVVKELYEPTSH